MCRERKKESPFPQFSQMGITESLISIQSFLNVLNFAIILDPILAEHKHSDLIIPRHKLVKLGSINARRQRSSRDKVVLCCLCIKNFQYSLIFFLSRFKCLFWSVFFSSPNEENYPILTSTIPLPPLKKKKRYLDLIE